MTVGVVPTAGGGPALIDQSYILGLAGGTNRPFQNRLVATAGGTKAAAQQLAAGVAIFGFATVATNGDSALLPKAVAGTVICVRNAGAATLSLYGSGTDKINGVDTATNYDLLTNTSAIFFCALDGAWSAVKTA